MTEEQKEAMRPGSFAHNAIELARKQVGTVLPSGRLHVAEVLYLPDGGYILATLSPGARSVHCEVRDASHATVHTASWSPPASIYVSPAGSASA